jgi:hypothetical protein
MGIVILKDAHVSTRKELEAKESIKKQIQNTFKSNPLHMKKNLVKKQVMKGQSKIFKIFNIKRGNLILLRCIKPCFP